MISPVASRTITDRKFVTTSASVRPASTAGARHRQRAEAVDQALVEVLVEPERRDEPAEGDVLDDDPRDQEVDVGVARRADRAAEDVDEQQHEHDRLHGEREQQVGGPRQAHEVALGDHEACRSPGASCRHLRFRLVLLGRRAAGEREEHVVERRAAQAEVVDPDARLVEAADRLDDRPAAAGGRRCARRRRRPPACSSDIGASARWRDVGGLRRRPGAPRGARRRRGP